jgi:hypothetical protein
MSDMERDIDTYHLRGIVLGFGFASFLRNFTSKLPGNVEDFVWLGLTIVWFAACIYVVLRHKRR